MTRTDCPFWSDTAFQQGAHNGNVEAAQVAPITGDLCRGGRVELFGVGETTNDVRSRQGRSSRRGARRTSPARTATVPPSSSARTSSPSSSLTTPPPARPPTRPRQPAGDAPPTHRPRVIPRQQTRQPLLSPIPDPLPPLGARHDRSPSDNSACRSRTIRAPSSFTACNPSLCIDNDKFRLSLRLVGSPPRS
jgi:hypothetical protein